jgi:glycosyltransferase involved in cell wall biosynthesis
MPRVVRRERSVVIVAPHFPPSNLTAGHRTRLLGMHLHKFGWRVCVLSVDPRYYAEALDLELEKLVPPQLEVIRTRALPIRPLRLVGDLGIRAFWWHYRELGRLIRRREVDLVYIPIPPNFSAVLGPLVQLRYGVPFAVDYIDPWVHPWPGCEVPLSKAWWAFRLGKMLEPFVLHRVCLVSSVAAGYYEGALQRSPWLDPSRCVAMPYGAEESDFDFLDRHPRRPFLFDPHDGNRHVVYAGAMLPRAYSTLEALFTAVRHLSECDPRAGSRLRLHFVGTGSVPSDPSSHLVTPWGERLGVSEMVREHPARIPYLDALNHLKHAHAVLVLGSSEPHYTASKVFQAVLARRPVIGILHAQSTAADILRRANAGPVVTFDDAHPALSRVEQIERALREALQDDSYVREKVDWEAFRAYSAEAMAERLAAAFDAALERTA